MISSFSHGREPLQLLPFLRFAHGWISELKDDVETIHSDWLHRLANLTLTAYNSKYSNSPFSEKKTMQDGYLQSGIKMNQRVAQKEHWGLAELEERCGYLTQQAIQLWPYAASSYTPPQKQCDEVALDDEINLTGRTLVKYRFRGIEHDTTSWAEMYAAVLKELHNADKSYLNYLADADDSVDLSIHVSRTSDNYTSCVKVDEDIYVWTGTATQYKINLLRKFFEQYKQDPSDLVFFLDDAKDTGSEDEAERHKIRRKYWEKALPLIQKTTGSFQNANPQKNNAVYGGTNKPGVLISKSSTNRFILYFDDIFLFKTQSKFKRFFIDGNNLFLTSKTMRKSLHNAVLMQKAAALHHQAESDGVHGLHIAKLNAHGAEIVADMLALGALGGLDHFGIVENLRMITELINVLIIGDLCKAEYDVGRFHIRVADRLVRNNNIRLGEGTARLGTIGGGQGGVEALFKQGCCLTHDLAGGD